MGSESRSASRIRRPKRLCRKPRAPKDPGRSEGEAGVRRRPKLLRRVVANECGYGQFFGASGVGVGTEGCDSIGQGIEIAGSLSWLLADGRARPISGRERAPSDSVLKPMCRNCELPKRVPGPPQTVVLAHRQLEKILLSEARRRIFTSSQRNVDIWVREPPCSKAGNPEAMCT
jgi:hypothetical protein